MKLKIGKALAEEIQPLLRQKRKRSDHTTTNVKSKPGSGGGSSSDIKFSSIISDSTTANLVSSHAKAITGKVATVVPSLDRSREKRYKDKGFRYIIGVDEAGRGIELLANIIFTIIFSILIISHCDVICRLVFLDTTLTCTTRPSSR